MPQPTSYYKELLSGFYQHTISESGVKELYAFIEEFPETYEQLMQDQEIIELLDRESVEEQGELSQSADDRIRANILAHAQAERSKAETSVTPAPYTGAIRPIARWRLTAVAAIILAAVASIWLLTRSPRQQEPVAENDSALIRTVPNIPAPAGDRATITLGSGKVVPVDSIGAGLLAGRVTRVVRKNDGQISYERTTGNAETQLVMNTLTNPRGSKVVNITLNDGSRVWLNAGSSITYPVAFNGGERKVKVSGEAYFDIAPNARQPFLVSSGNVTIEVLGTGFNVDAYTESGQPVRTTLLQGAIRVKKGTQNAILRPGQQAQAGDALNVISDVDVNQVVAWKNGYFNFENMGIRDVMQQLEVWYNITVAYEGAVPDIHFFGELRRDTNLPGVIAALHDAGLHFKMDGNKLVVLP